MADLFLHLPFARRLRLAEGLHPLIGETLARRQSLVAFGATLPLLPGVERQGMSFFRRLFSGGGEAARWQKQLAPAASPRVELVKRFIIGGDPGQGLGTMSRLALALGVLSHELLEMKLQGLVSPTASDRAAIERAQARLWMQAAIPNNIENEWKPTTELADAELHKRTFEHVDNALKAAFGQGPGRDTLLRWAKGLVVEVAPALQRGMPAALSIPDHSARGPHFENNNFVAKAQEAVAAFVVIANRLGERFTTSPDLDAMAIVEALCGPSGNGVVSDSDSDAPNKPARWTAWIVKKRIDTLERGRNDKPAFIEGLGEVKPIHRSAAFTGMMNLADIPTGELPPDLRDAQGLPPPSAVLAPPVPPGSDISLAAVEAAAGHAPPLPLDTSGPVPGLPVVLPPALTQEISVHQIESEMRAFPTPPMTQEIHSAQIEAEAHAFTAPAMTQEVSQVQIEAQAVLPPAALPPAHHANGNGEIQNGEQPPAPPPQHPPSEPPRE
ncbi:MAG: hypothetical protein Q8O67_17995 [Deltaproteobacteria bacterium]|nr:hypothetical protein [Deltaproteobacteria bacterium]